MNRFSILGKIYYKILNRVNPIKAARSLGLNMGDNVHIYGNVKFGTEPWIITLGNNVYLTDEIKFMTHDGGTLLFRKEIPDLEITKPISLGNDVYVGNNAIFMPGVHVGNRVVIGAGAIVTKDIPDNSVAVGVPARVIKSVDEYLEKIKAESLHLGHLKGKQKDDALKKLFSYHT